RSSRAWAARRSPRPPRPDDAAQHQTEMLREQFLRLFGPISQKKDGQSARLGLPRISGTVFTGFGDEARSGIVDGFAQLAGESLDAEGLGQQLHAWGEHAIVH